MEQKHLSWVLLFHTDAHAGEYINECDNICKALSGFTGSNATLLIGVEEAYLWTDGRYFLQADEEIRESGFSLMKEGVVGEPSPKAFLKKRLKRNDTLFLNDRTTSVERYREYEKLCASVRAQIVVEDDLYSLWDNRPKRVSNPVFLYEEVYSGRSVLKKYRALIREIKKAGAKGCLLSDLTQIAWLLNLRGTDFSYVPVFYAFLYVNQSGLYVFSDALSKEIPNSKEKNDFSDLYNKNIVQIFPYSQLYSFLNKIEDETVLLDEKSISIACQKAFFETTKQIFAASPVETLKAVKNKTEIRATKSAHIKDGVAVTKFLYAMKTRRPIKSRSVLTETDAAKMLYGFRKEQPDFLGESFASIVAYGPNAAKMHYTATENNESYILDRGFLLVDSGGHYKDGTTDVTRTLALGFLSDWERRMYTLCLKGHLALMRAVFPENTLGESLDVLARAPLWQEDLDYRSGTGHGVGHVLSVHEGPHAIRHTIHKKSAFCALRPGMIVTDEPGYYEDHRFGIRIENELLVKRHGSSEYGSFLCFEPLTYVPYESSAVIVSMLSAEEKETYNAYHRAVRNKIGPHLKGDEREWLYQQTQPI